MEPDWDGAAQHAVGTTTSIKALIEKYDLPDDYSEIEAELAERYRLSICPVCGWWAHTWHPDGVCEEDAEGWDT